MTEQTKSPLPIATRAVRPKAGRSIGRPRNLPARLDHGAPSPEVPQIAKTSVVAKYVPPDLIAAPRVLPTPAGSPSGGYHLLAISNGAPVDQLSAHTKCAASLILHEFAIQTFDSRELHAIVGAASTGEPTRRQLRMLDDLSMRLAHIEHQLGRALDG